MEGLPEPKWQSGLINGATHPRYPFGIDHWSGQRDRDVLDLATPRERHAEVGTRDAP